MISAVEEAAILEKNFTTGVAKLQSTLRPARVHVAATKNNNISPGLKFCDLWC